jgi:hypothetical protein
MVDRLVIWFGRMSSWRQTSCDLSESNVQILPSRVQCADQRDSGFDYSRVRQLADVDLSLVADRCKDSGIVGGIARVTEWLLARYSATALTAVCELTYCNFVNQKAQVIRRIRKGIGL